MEIPFASAKPKTTILQWDANSSNLIRCAFCATLASTGSGFLEAQSVSDGASSIFAYGATVRSPLLSASYAYGTGSSCVCG